MAQPLQRPWTPLPLPGPLGPPPRPLIPAPQQPSPPQTPPGGPQEPQGQPLVQEPQEPQGLGRVPQEHVGAALLGRATPEGEALVKRLHSYASRVTARSFLAEYLPAAESDPKIRDVVQRTILADFASDPEHKAWQERMAHLKPEFRPLVDRHLEAYAALVKEAQHGSPLGALYRMDQDRQAEMLYQLIRSPGGADRLQDFAQISGNELLQRQIQEVETRERRLAAVHSLLGVASGSASPLTMEGFRGLQAATAEQIKQQRHRRGHTLMGAAPQPEEVQQSLAIRQFTPTLSRYVADAAEQLGMDYQAVEKMPATMAAAQKVLKDALPVIERLSKEEQRDLSLEEALFDSATARGAFLDLANLLYLYQREHPDETQDVGQILRELDDLAVGRVSAESGTGALRVAAEFLNMLGKPAQSVGALLDANDKRLGTVGFMFADGRVFQSEVSAAAYSLYLERTRGAKYEYAPGMEEAQRLGMVGALVGEKGYAYRGDVRMEVNPAEALETQQRLTANGERAASYSKPMPLVDVTRERDGWLKGLQRAGKVFTELHSDAPYVFDTALNRYDPTGAVRREGGLPSLAMKTTAFAKDVFLDPLMAMSSVPYGRLMASTIAAKRAEQVERAAKLGKLADAGTEVVGPWKLLEDLTEAEFQQSLRGLRGADVFSEPAASLASKEARAVRGAQGATIGGAQLRKVRFEDGRIMPPEWAAAHDNIARMFGSGGFRDAGGGEEFARYVLSRVRDNPEIATDAAGLLIKDGANLRYIHAALQDAGITGLEDGWRAAIKAGRDPIEATAQFLNRNMRPVQTMLDSFSMSFGTGARGVADLDRKAMRIARGIYFGDIDLFSGDRFMQAAAKSRDLYDGLRSKLGLGDPMRTIWRQIAPLAAPATRGVYMAGREAYHQLARVFTPSYWWTQERGPLGLPRVHKVPWVVRHHFETAYRRSLSSASQRIDGEVYRLFADRENPARFITERDRKFIAHAMEGGQTQEEVVDYVTRNYDMIFDTERAPANVIAKVKGDTERLWGLIRRLQDEHDEAINAAEMMGILREGAGRVENYILHYFRRPEQARNLVRDARNLTEAKERLVAAAKAVGTEMRSGRSARPRHGPVTLLEGKLLGLDPVEDAAILFERRMTEAAEVKARSRLYELVSSYVGVPGVRGNEAVVRAIQNQKDLRYLEAAAGVPAAHEEAVLFQAHRKRVADIARSPRIHARKRAVLKLADNLGVGARDLLGPEDLVPALTRSRRFASLAASRGRNMLDKILRPETRAALRPVAERYKKLLGWLESSEDYIRSRGLQPEIFHALTEDERGRFWKAYFETRDMRPSIEAYRARAEEMAARAKAVQENLRWHERELKAYRQGHGELSTQRRAIAKEWDKVKDWLEKNGINTGILVHADVEGRDAAARFARDNMRRTEVRTSGTYLETLREKILEYKKHQAEYVDLSRDLEAGEAAVRKQRERIAETTKRLDKANADLERSRRAIKMRQQEEKARRRVTREQGKTLVRTGRKLDKTGQMLLDKVALSQTVRRTMEELMRTGTMMEAVDQVVAATHLAAQENRQVRAIISQMGRRFGISETEARMRVFASRRGSILRTQFGQHAARYRRAQELLHDLEMTRDEQQALLWDVFNASSIAEVPIVEFEEFAANMQAKLGRFVLNPIDVPDDRFLAIKMKRSLLDVPGALEKLQVGTIEEAQGLIRLSEYKAKRGIPPMEKRPQQWARVRNARERVERLTPGEIDALKRTTDADLRVIPERVGMDIGETFDDYIRRGGRRSTEYMAKVLGHGNSRLARILQNTYVPVEIGLILKTMLNERVIGPQDLTKFGLGVKLANWVNTVFKSNVTSLRPSLEFGRRNSIFDGYKMLFQLGLLGAHNPREIAQFYRDMRAPAGKWMMTANGPVSVFAISEALKKQGITTFAIRTDVIQEQGRALSQRELGRAAKRFEERIVQVGREAVRTKGLRTPRGAEIVGKVPAPHTSGRLPTLFEWVFPWGPAAAESLENHFRQFIAYEFVKSGMGIQEAVDRMLVLARDYSNLKPMERKFLRLGPVLFYNFTKQNTVAQLSRILENPGRAVVWQKFLRSIGDNLGDEYREDWQYISSSFVRGGEVNYINDELSATVEWLQPFVTLMGAAQGKEPWSSVADEVSRQAAPWVSAFVKPLAGGQGQLAPWRMPKTIARSLYESTGNINTPLVKVYQNEDGLVVGELTGMGQFIAAMTGFHVMASAVGRPTDEIASGRIVQGGLEWLGFGKRYPLDSFAEFAAGRATDKKVQDIVRALDSLRWDPDFQRILLDDDFVDEESRQAIMELIGGKGGANHYISVLKQLDNNMRKAMGGSKTPGSERPFLPVQK